MNPPVSFDTPILPPPDELAELWMISFGMFHGERRQPQPWERHPPPYTKAEATWDMVLELAAKAQHWSDMERKYPNSAYIGRMAFQANKAYLRTYSLYSGW